jgi:hypothetical protein
MRGFAAAIVIFACLGVLAWAPPLHRTVVHVHPGADGLAFTVNAQPLGDGVLTDTTLEHAIRDNPQMAVENIYRDALIVLCSGEGVSASQMREVHELLSMEGFANIEFGQSYDCSNGN